MAVPLGCDSAGPPNGENDDDPAPPSAPTSLNATVDNGTVELTWDGVSDTDAYNVYRSTAPTDSAAGEPLATGVSSPQYTDDTAANGATYYYRVTAVTGDRESDASSEATVEMPVAEPGGGADDAWTRVKSTVDNTIYDVARTTEGAYAVAGGGILLKRQDTSWVKVLNDGPSSNGNDLLALAATDDGEHLWFVGASGAVGEWDVTTGSLVQDHSGPNDSGSNFQDVAVTGPSDDATIHAVGASGQVFVSTDDGATWNASTPGNGSALRAIDTYEAGSGHLVDANQSVFETTDNWSSRTKTGIADADVGFYGVDSDATDDVWVAGGSGTLFHWTGSAWSTTNAGEPDLADVEVAGNDQSGFAVGNSGAVFAYDGSAWTRQETPTGENLTSVIQGDPAIAVGASGTVLER